MCPSSETPPVALLGPTNTGKTHRALQRMLEHSTAMIGLPLRLLAREVYDRLTSAVGEAPVALLTGEEKRVGTRPRYWVCTVEAMPMDRSVDFVAIDEIQLCAHPQRGHLFTERLLEARGLKETWVMGADTMRPLVETLLPHAEVLRHPRLSDLRWRGQGTLGKLPPRSAVISFSVPGVVRLAERVRRRRGGAAVVMGALSPRARNAQVALYQSGEVDFLVATDAIGMGLNLDLDHVAFAERRKFDGREERLLDPAELAQIAGRAGRYQNDGSFGTLAPEPELSPRIVRAIESHRFTPVRRILWRNSDLDFASLDALIESLKVPSPRRSFQHARRMDDFLALAHFAHKPEIRDRAGAREHVELVWQICQIPDYRQLTFDVHLRFLEQLCQQLLGSRRCVDLDWARRNVDRLDDPRGDIDTLTMRMAAIRTWTYVAHRGGWLPNPSEWQERTRAIEDRLSDALHERLVERFVAAERRGPRASALGTSPLDPSMADKNAFVSQLRRIRQSIEPRALGATSTAASVQDLLEASHDRFKVDLHGRILWQDRVIGSLSRGQDLLHPEVTLADGADLGAGARWQLQRRLRAWTRDMVNLALGPLRHPDTGSLSPAGRGLVYQLEQKLGTVLAATARPQLAALCPEDRELLDRLGIRLGHRLVYVPSLLTPQAVHHRVVLCGLMLGRGRTLDEPPAGAPSIPADPAVDREIYTAIGYPVLGPRAVRADIAEQVDGLLYRAARKGPFAIPPEVVRLLGCAPALVARVVQRLGYRAAGSDRFVRSRKRRGRRA